MLKHNITSMKAAKKSSKVINMFLINLLTVVMFVSFVSGSFIGRGGPWPDDSHCESQEDYYYLDPKDSCSCWCLNEKVFCPQCFDPTTNDAIPYCKDQGDHQIDPTDPCSCWCVNQEMVCDGCLTDPPTELPDTTTIIEGVCDESRIYAIDRYDPCTCWCAGGNLVCPVCTLPPDYDEFTQSNECVGQEDHKVDPDDACSCWCLGEHLTCPECNVE